MRWVTEMTRTWLQWENLEKLNLFIAEQNNIIRTNYIKPKFDNK